VLENARYWFVEYGFDGLRLDATHQIFDPTERHILSELSRTAKALTRPRSLIAEDERNQPELLLEHGIDAQWADDFHHQVQVLLTGERDGYYAAYEPNVTDLARCIERGWLYEGQLFVPSNKPRGAPADSLRSENFVYCIQNHDQVGNRALGERLNHLLQTEAYAAASMLLLFLPMVPLLFMGQEWAASTPFLYFTDHELSLGEAVTRGRRAEFSDFEKFRDPTNRNAIPDPQSPATFEKCKLQWDEAGLREHARVLALYKAMLTLRRTHRVLRGTSRQHLSTQVQGEVLSVLRTTETQDRLVLLVNFARQPQQCPEQYRSWTSVITSCEARTGVSIAEVPSLGAVILKPPVT
jgi:maltooligosyltrehalose trehalohydrolase